MDDLKNSNFILVSDYDALVLAILSLKRIRDGPETMITIYDTVNET